MGVLQSSPRPRSLGRSLSCHPRFRSDRISGLRLSRPVLGRHHSPSCRNNREAVIVDLNTVTALRRPSSPGEIDSWRDGFAWLAGGTWLFSEPQPAIDTLIDLEPLGWKALDVSAEGLEIAATCRIVELYHFEPPAEWTAAPLLRECCRAFLSSL